METQRSRLQVPRVVTSMSSGLAVVGMRFASISGYDSGSIALCVDLQNSKFPWIVWQNIWFGNEGLCYRWCLLSSCPLEGRGEWIAGKLRELGGDLKMAEIGRTFETVSLAKGRSRRRAFEELDCWADFAGQQDQQNTASLGDCTCWACLSLCPADVCIRIWSLLLHLLSSAPQ